MAVLFDSSSDSLVIDTSLPSSTAFSICGWAVRTSSPGAVYHPIFQINSAGGAQYMTLVYRSTDGVTLGLVTSGSSVNFPSSPAINDWFFWALVCQGTGANDLIGYWWGPGAAVVTTSMAGISLTPTQVWIGSDDIAGFLRGALGNVKMWSAVLTSTELQAEMWSYLPRRFTNLSLWTPLLTAADSNGYSVGSNNWTNSGTLTSHPGPPIPWSLRRRKGVMIEAPVVPPPNFGIAVLGQWDVELHPRAWF